jgi:hypothetical protein
MVKILEEHNVPEKMLKISLTCQVGKSLDLAKFAIKYAIENSGMDFGSDISKINPEFDICFICWKTSDEVYDWLRANNYWFITIDHESEADQSFHHLLYNGWRAGYEIAYRYSDFHVPIATDHYFFKDWLKNLYNARVNTGIVSCTLIERGNTFSLHPTCDLGLTTDEDFNFARAEQVYNMLYCEKIFVDLYEGQYHLDHGIADKKIRQDAMPFIISRHTYDLVGPMADFNEHGTTGDTAMFDKCIELGIRRHRCGSSLSYHVGAVETKRNSA